MADITDFPVMKKKCGTCPFRTNEQGKYNDAQLVNRIKKDILTEASQICHHPRLDGKEETHLCRGARDYQLEIFHRIGFLDAPTDDAWNECKNTLLGD